ncbi:MAG: SDR family oxidoreductase [Pseudomonadota bacterium]|jgi:NAD(P)-dependent dehydrogenase (short-subunit alcohol dehydrogenase family)|nr:SDR family oxidoreductase [Rubrivivax sp.]MCA3257986.1 SDR family oxidoreductase [Rubrivivax sp.]MCE2911397.1 SDR family oxidoreductase [Rubrivivax sp.]MCZ8032311.1 SDR family oxidoreductase [Rubrivivax sp.]
MLRFEGKVALVTGAGRGLGRAHALMLAARGAKVLVNDLGTGGAGEGHDASPAQAVVDEIRAAGGQAQVNGESVVEGGRIVEAALDHFGRLDIVVNNAGFLRDVAFHKMTARDWDTLYEVHLLGAFRIIHAAWPRMREQAYGRIVNTSSAAGIYGNFGQVNYGTFKLALHGMTQPLAVEGKARGIHVNTIAPAADSRLTRTVMTAEQLAPMRPDLVSPLVAWLCHDACPETGGLFEVGGGYIAKLRWERSAGVRLDLAGADAVENIAAAWGQITSFEHSDHPAGFGEAMAPFARIMQGG